MHVLEAEAVVGVGAHGQHEALPAQQRQEGHEVRPVDAILTSTTTHQLRGAPRRHVHSDLSADGRTRPTVSSSAYNRCV